MANVKWTRGELATELDTLLRNRVPYDLTVSQVPRGLEPRLRPFMLSYPHFGAQFSLGYEDLKQFPSVVVVVLFTDVAVDYYIKEVIDRLASVIRNRFREAKICYDGYETLRKELAVRTGLGTLGRNGLFFSKKFGFNCKIEAIFTDIEFDTYGALGAHSWKLGPCETCNMCVSACPVNAYDDFRVHDPVACDKHITPDWDHPERMCRNCIISCPYSEVILERLYDRGVHPRLLWDPNRHHPDNFEWQVGVTLVGEEGGSLLVVTGPQSDDARESPRFSGMEGSIVAWMSSLQRPFGKTEVALKFSDYRAGNIDSLCQKLIQCGALKPFQPLNQTEGR